MQDLPHDPPLLRPAVGLLLVRDGAVLLGHRTGGTDPETWGTPGGKIDFGEDAAAAVARELVEEAGTSLVTTRPRMLPLAVHDVYPDRGEQYSTHMFVAEWVEGEAEIVEPNKCREWRWWPWEALPENTWGGTKIAKSRYPDMAQMLLAASYSI